MGAGASGDETDRETKGREGMNVTALFATLVTIAVIPLVYFISKRLTGDGEVSIIIALLSVPVLCVAILIYVLWYAVFAL